MSSVKGSVTGKQEMFNILSLLSASLLCKMLEKDKDHLASLFISLSFRFIVILQPSRLSTSLFSVFFSDLQSPFLKQTQGAILNRQ